MRARTHALVLVLVWTVVVTSTAKAEKNYFPSFADEHTVGLWLFDETDYPYTTLTDASKFEYDLRLMKGGKMVCGKYGNCLKCTPGLDYATSYAAWKGAVGFNHMREMSGRPGSGLFGPTIAPKELLRALASSDFTCEFWLLLMSNPIQDVALIDLGNKFEPGLTVTLRTRAQGFVVENAYAGFQAICPAILDQLWGRAWHHVAFTYSASSNTLQYYIDGQAQPPVTTSKIATSAVPASIRPESIADTTMGGIFEKDERSDVPDYDKRIRHRFNFAIGHDRRGNADFNGNIDELRFSSVVRYRTGFALPGSLSRNYRRTAPKPPVPNGPPLLFGPDKTYLPGEPIMLGSRKHVFIDEVMVEKKQNVTLTLNPPTDAVEISEKAAWDASFFEHKGKIYTVVSEGYEGAEGPINLLVSDDGINFEKPNLGLIEHNGSTNNNLIMLGLPSWGKYFKDPNPACPAEELFKATLWVGQRGIYLYFSPDMIHWRRNETCMLPLVSGGGCETFWDDQQGMYFNYIKRDGSYNTGDYPNYGRSTTMFKTREINKPWPFNPVPNPYYEGWPFPAVTGEGITVMGPNVVDADNGQIFRTRPQKYEWAPDTYVAFMIRSGCDMGVSRDAVNWKICSKLGLGHYLPRGTTVDGRKFANAEVSNGLIRRGDDIWQYANCHITGHKTVTVRLKQRLDGFLSLDVGQQTGTIITRPFVFEGNKLTINANVKGYLKVAILNLPGMEITGFNIGLTNSPKKPVPGFGLHGCDTIKGDSTQHTVAWKGNSSVGNLAGQVVRLRFDMQSAKLYAFEFD
ncbi:MAG: LamG-like jellyroll fold domain-containing protein [Planctomycetota bacterium]